MKKYFLLCSLFFISTLEAQECNTDKRQSLWIEAIHLSSDASKPSHRVSYKARDLWTTALPELGLMSYWTEDQSLAEPTLVIKSLKGSVHETLSLKKISNPSFKPKENLVGFSSNHDLNSIIKNILVEHEEAQLLFEVRLDQATLCRHKMDISRLIDQE